MRVLAQAKKWWWTVLEIEISCSQWEGSACTQSALNFFLLSFGWVGGFGGRGRGFFFLFFFVPNIFPKFPMCSQREFSIAPHFNPRCFAQSPPLLTYIAGPKAVALHLSIESFILGSLHSFNFFWNGPIKLAHCKKKKKKEKKKLKLWGTPN